MEPDLRALDDVMESTDFSGVVAIGGQGRDVRCRTRGLANRADGRPITAGTRFGIASGTKGFTAIAVASLVEEGVLGFDTPVVEVLGHDLPDIDRRVTIEHLLGHRSGIGDYLDEELQDDIDEHVLGGASAHRFETPEDYLDLVTGFPQVSAPGERFAYNNGAFVVLSIIVERLAEGGFHRAVRERVFEPAGMTSSDFFRSDDPPPDLATGYLVDGKTNVFHLPVLGAGDGGAHCTAGDVIAFWSALLQDRLLSPSTVQRLIGWHSDASETEGPGVGYGLGFWLDDHGVAVALEGMDAGVSFRSAVDPATGAAWVVLSNTSSGAWPLARALSGRPST